MFLKLVSGIALIIGILEVALNGNYIGGGCFGVAAILAYHYSKPRFERTRIF